MSNFLNKLGGRRFTLSISSIILGVFLQWFGKLDSSGNTLFLILTAAIGSFTTSDTIDKVKSRINNGNQTGTTSR